MARPVAFEDFPNVTTYADRKGETRYRFRHKGVTGTLPGKFGSPEFKARYNELVEEAAKTTVKSPARAMPLPEKCFRNYWEDFKKSRELTAKVGDVTLSKIIPPLLRFLETPVAEDVPFLTFDMVPVNEITFQQIDDYLWNLASNKTCVKGLWCGGPHAANYAYIQLEKLFKFAVRKQLIKPAENPMLYVERVDAPKNKRANRPWTAEERAKFEARYPLGTVERTVYAVALYMGNRRSDIATIMWDHLYEVAWGTNPDGTTHYVEVFKFIQVKNSKKKGADPKEVFIPVVPMLAEALAHIERMPGKTVIINKHGNSYKASTLTLNMADWRKKAGLPVDCKLHGLRSTFATMLKEIGASGKGSKSLMGHTDEAMTAWYQRNADDRMAALASAAMLESWKPTDLEIRPARHLRLVS